MTFTIHIAAWVWPLLAGLIIGFVVGFCTGVSRMFPTNI